MLRDHVNGTIARALSIAWCVSRAGRLVHRRRLLSPALSISLPQSKSPAPSAASPSPVGGEPLLTPVRPVHHPPNRRRRPTRRGTSASRNKAQQLSPMGQPTEPRPTHFVTSASFCSKTDSPSRTPVHPAQTSPPPDCPPSLPPLASQAAPATVRHRHVPIILLLLLLFKRPPLPILQLGLVTFPAQA